MYPLLRSYGSKEGLPGTTARWTNTFRDISPSAVFLPEPSEPTTAFLFRHLLQLAGIEPDPMTRAALIDGNLLKAPLFELAAALRAFHEVIGFRLLGFGLLFGAQLGELLALFLEKIFVFLGFSALIPLIGCHRVLPLFDYLDALFSKDFQTRRRTAAMPGIRNIAVAGAMRSSHCPCGACKLSL
jgi:hypothetical protein